MYRKSMRSALAEARAYTEANMKRILQALQDKLSKEGGAAGFDDLKKTAKSMGLNLTPQMLKNMPGIKQHRDGDYILEELEEAMNRFGLNKKIIQTLQDKLRKEGGAAGFDDLKKAARSIGFNLTPQILKNTPGIKQHRDGDYILTAGPPIELMLTFGKPGEKVKTYYTKFMQDLQNKASELRRKGFVVDKMGRKQPMSQLRDRIPEELDIDNMTEEQLDEALDVKWDSNKQGWFDRQGRRRYLGVMATNKLMAKALDKAKKTGDFINPYKLKHGQRPEETELEEAFSKKDFQKLEQSNDHTEAAKKLIDMFGTSDEKKEMNDIKARHEKTGYISGKDYSRRIQLTNRYYSRLK